MLRHPCHKKLSDHRTTSLNYRAWERLLPEDYEQRDFILNGIKDGFHIIDPDCISHSVEMDNYTSAAAENVRAQVETQILTEIQNGRYRIVDKKPPIISALEAIPKKDPNKVRLIHDASRPKGQALNDDATTDHFQYQSIQDAVDLVTPNCFFREARSS